MISREPFVVDLTVEGCPCEDETLRGLQVEHSKLLFGKKMCEGKRNPVCACGGGGDSYSSRTSQYLLGYGIDLLLRIWSANIEKGLISLHQRIFTYSWARPIKPDSSC